MRRIISMYIELPKNGVINVDNDHMNTANAKIVFPLLRLAALAPITYKYT